MGELGQRARGTTTSVDEEPYRTIVEHSSESIFLVDVETKHVLEANAALRRLLGYIPTELVGVTLYDLVAHERESIDYYVECALQEGKYYIGECEYCRKDGSLVEVEVSASLISYGGVQALCWASHDIAERKSYERQIQQSVDSLLAIYEASQLLSSTLKSEEIGTRLLGLMQRISSLTTAVISVPDEGGHLRVWRAVGFGSLWSRARYTPEVQRALYEVLQTGEYRMLELQHPYRRTERLSTLYLPLRIHERTLGVLEVYGPDDLSEGETVEILISLTSKAASALENARLYGELAERERRLQELVGKLITVQEEERRRVAYEVHDRLTQMAVASYQHLQAYAGHSSPGSLQSQELLKEATELIRKTIEESRQVIADLRPTELDDFGLAAAIRLRAEDLREEGWEVTYEEDLGDERLPAPVETTLYRVLQEALTNVRKHARTARVHVKLVREEQVVQLQVLDWGKGFDPTGMNAKGPGERMGISGMRERVALIGGELKVHSEENVGTWMTARVPLL